MFSKQKVFCVLLENDPHFYYIDFQSLNDDNPNFVNPYENVFNRTETIHDSFYQDYLYECESQRHMSYAEEH